MHNRTVKKMNNNNSEQGQQGIPNGVNNNNNNNNDNNSKISLDEIMFSVLDIFSSNQEQKNDINKDLEEVDEKHSNNNNTKVEKDNNFAICLSNIFDFNGRCVEFTNYADGMKYKKGCTIPRYIFLHGLLRSDTDVLKLMLEVTTCTKICPIDLNNFRSGEKSCSYGMKNQLYTLFHGLVEYYGGSENMFNKSIIISGHSQGSSLAIALGQLLNHMFDMQVFCPVYCPITQGAPAAKVYSNYIGAKGLLPGSSYMKMIEDGFKILKQNNKEDYKLLILPFAAKVPSSIQRQLSLFSFFGFPHLAEDNDTLLSFKSQKCLNIPKDFILKEAVSIEACHESPDNLIPVIKSVANILLKDVTPILEHEFTLSKTIEAIEKWMKMCDI